ncbi:integrator complex subunit 9 isoform X2 [Jatropha curcas]|uniref:integrator complex subunit 9 isoform X2 n=1 Tax=Jatropha curcas TaxID=180498 RepID=UPI0009D6FE64|nr:integrator complex subunit 9 isoform X2 [Jatropha curcas]
MKFTCLSKGNGFHLPPCYIVHASGFRILLDCPLDLSALTIFSPVPADFCPIVLEGSSNSPVYDSLNTGLETQKRCKIEKPLDAKNLIYAEPWYKTAKNLQFWDPSSIDIVLISSTMGMLGLPFLTRSKGFSAKIYTTEATARLGQLMMEDLVSMHNEFRNFYGPTEFDSPQWMKWEELELLPSSLGEVALGKDGSELGSWMPLYRSVDVHDCMQKVQTLKYAEAACHNGALVIKAFSSGLEIGSCNWTVEGPEENFACVSSSIFVSAHAMEFDYRALQGKDLILYSDFSAVIEDVEHHDNDSSPTTNNLSTISDEDNQKELNECLLSNDESLLESEKLAFICSCVVDSVTAGGSVLFPLNRLGIVLQLLEQIPISLESSDLKVPIYIISSIAAELLAFTNIIPEWLCKLRQEKLFSGEPLFSHIELMKGKKLHVFPDLHSPNLITNWREPCIIFAPHWSLRLGPLVHLVRRWSGDQNSLLVLEDRLDADMALLPFKPIAMKVLQCSFISGIQMRKAQPLLSVLQPKTVVLPEDLKPKVNDSKSSSHSFSVFYYNENETLDIQSLKDSFGVEIATDLATSFSWRKLKQNNMDVTRLDGQLFINDKKHQLLLGDKVLDSSESRPLLQWGLLDMEKLLALLSKMGINGSIEQRTSDAESEIVRIIQIHNPNKALIEARATSTVISTCDENLGSQIFQAISSLLDAI